MLATVSPIFRRLRVQTLLSSFFVHVSADILVYISTGCLILKPTYRCMYVHNFDKLGTLTYYFQRLVWYLRSTYLHVVCTQSLHTGCIPNSTVAHISSSHFEGKISLIISTISPPPHRFHTTSKHTPSTTNWKRIPNLPPTAILIHHHFTQDGRSEIQPPGYAQC